MLLSQLTHINTASAVISLSSALTFFGLDHATEAAAAATDSQQLVTCVSSFLQLGHFPASWSSWVAFLQAEAAGSLSCKLKRGALTNIGQHPSVVGHRQRQAAAAVAERVPLNCV
jgi:hypothetical protein